MSWRLKTRTPRDGAVRWWIGAAGVVAAAAAAAYWLDAELGASRRARAAAQAAAMSQGVGAALERRVRYVTLIASERMRGRSTQPPMRGAGESWPEEAPPDVDSESVSEAASAP